MTILSLLGKSLKSDEVIELLQEYEVDVVYSFDRLHENSPDVYCVAIREAGFQLRFNEHQQLDTAFCYVAPREGFGPVALNAIGVPVFKSFAAAEQHCLSNSLEYEASAPPGMWLKVLGSSHDAHYQ